MKKYFFLLFIIFVATILRFYQLGINPPSLTWDEAAWGYNAYTLGLDGKDEFGRFMPHDYLESFGDFKPPLYAYLDVIPVKIFGLSEFATRFPSAFFGVLTVLITFFLTKEIFWKSKRKEWYALTSAGILALSPWHIMLSRAAFEANVATFFIVTGVWLFLTTMQRKPIVLILAAIAFVLSIYTFNTARIVSPLLVIILTFIFWKKLWLHKKQTLLALIIGSMVLLPTIKFLFTPQASLRFKEVNIFSDIAVITKTNQEVNNDNDALFSKIIHNRRLAYGVLFLRHYFDNLDPNFLFIKGDGNPKFSTQDIGELYLWDLPFFIVGIFFLFRKKEGNWFVIPLWLILGIIPAATARETPHALRIEAIIPTMQILVAYGVVNAIFNSQFSVLNKKLKRSILFALLGLMLLNVFYFLHGYYTHYPTEFSGEWQYGYKQSIAYVQREQRKYNHIVITNALGRPYIYYLFYLKTDPNFFRKTAVIHRDAFGFVHVEQFGMYYFPDNLSTFKPKDKVLVVATPGEIPGNAKVLKKFTELNGQTILEAYTL